MSKKIILYRPSSGSEGLWFDYKFCSKCKNQPIDPADGSCPLIFRMMSYDTYDEEYPREIQIINGKITCLEFKSRIKMQKYSVKIRIDNLTLHHATWEDKVLSSLEEAIAYYMKLHPKKPIEIWTGETLVWRSPAAVAIKNQNQFTLF